VEGQPQFGRDRKDLYCWHCWKPIPDQNEECGVCLWRICGCGACRQPTHMDTRGRIGPCPVEVEKLGLLLRDWDRTFDGEELHWPTAAELAVRPEVRQWIGAIGEKLGLRLLILDRSQYHSAFGLRLQLDSDIDFNRDPRIPPLLRGASNVSGASGVIVESRSGTRLSFVPGMGVFMKVGGRSFSDETLTDASALEGLEVTQRPLGLSTA
jgi:hypothetical protein